MTPNEEIEKLRAYIVQLRAEIIAVYEYIENTDPELSAKLRQEGLFPMGDDGMPI